MPSPRPAQQKRKTEDILPAVIRLLNVLRSLAVLALISVPYGGAGAQESDPALASYTALQKLDNKVLATGFRLTTANAPFCRDTEMRAGLLLHDLAQYKDRATARAAYGFDRDIAVLALAPGGPADKAGVHVGDSIVAINDADPLSGASDRGQWKGDDSYSRLANVLARWEADLAAGPVQIKLISRGASDTHVVRIIPVRACQSRFQVEPESSLNSAADGRMVTIYSQMAEYTADQDELAALVAHELAHNLLHHLKRLDAAGHSDGLFGAFGRNARLTKETEIEADRLSVWLMANAGYDPEGAVRFWTRFGKQHGFGIFSAPTHYRYKKRVGLFREEIAKMAAQGRGPDGYAPPLLVEPETALK